MKNIFQNQFKERFEKGLPEIRGNVKRPRSVSQTTWLAMFIIIVGAIVYTTPRYEVAVEQTIQVPARGFYGYDVQLTETNLVGVEIQSHNNLPFDFYILTTEEFDLLKHYIVNGKDVNREIVYKYRATNVKKVDMSNFGLTPGYYTLVMDNSYYDTQGSEENLLLDFKVLRKKKGV